MIMLINMDAHMTEQNGAAVQIQGSLSAAVWRETQRQTI